MFMSCIHFVPVSFFRSLCNNNKQTCLMPTSIPSFVCFLVRYPFFCLSDRTTWQTQRNGVVSVEYICINLICRYVFFFVIGSASASAFIHELVNHSINGIVFNWIINFSKSRSIKFELNIDRIWGRFGKNWRLKLVFEFFNYAHLKVHRKNVT